MTTIIGSGALGGVNNYRETVSSWFRSTFLLDPKPELMAEALPSFRVHVFSAPNGYVFRPYVLYRSNRPHDAGVLAPKRGWEKVG